MSGQVRILGLPGRDAATETWLRNLLVPLTFDGSGHRVQRYQFWEDTARAPDVAVEAVLAAQSAAEIVIAKSFGTLVAMTAWRSHGLKPRRLVFIGIPLAHFTADMTALLHEFCDQNAVLFVQQTDDFMGTFAVLNGLVSQHPRCKAIEIDGSDHRYDKIVAANNAIHSWCWGDG